MLIKPTREEGESYIDFAYELALDPSRSGYPTYADGIKTKEDFADTCISGLTREDRQVLLYMEDGAVSGWIQFLIEEDSKYLETNVFNISGDTARALGEFIDYCADHFPGAKLCLGFPGDNKEAVDFLTSCGLRCEEHSFNDVLCFDHYDLLPETGNVVRVNRDNFDDFRKIHEPIQGEMYWNCDRLFDALDSWTIWMLYENGQPAGAIYDRDAEVLMHIYGIDYLDDIFQESTFRALLIKELNECKRAGKKYMVFFNDAETQQTVLDLGFTCVGEYMLFVKNI